MQLPFLVRIGTLAWSIDKDGKFTGTPATLPMRGADERFFPEKHAFEFWIGYVKHHGPTDGSSVVVDLK